MVAFGASGVSSFSFGTYNGTTTLSDVNATNSPKTINVSMIVSYEGTSSTVSGGVVPVCWFF